MVVVVNAPPKSRGEGLAVERLAVQDEFVQAEFDQRIDDHNQQQGAKEQCADGLKNELGSHFVESFSNFGIDL